MNNFPYTQVPKKLKSFFEKIQQTGTPNIVDKKWLASIGFGASNDRSIIPVLKFISFVDQSGKPTKKWLVYRDKNQARKVLAEGIREGYAELFQTYPDAHQRTDDELKNFFSPKTKASASTVSRMVTTFKTLCKLADFSDVSTEASVSQALAPSEDVKTEPDTTKKITQKLGTGITININIQLTLPDTTDETVYDKFFVALKKHLFS